MRLQMHDHGQQGGGGMNMMMMPMTFEAGIDTVIWFDWWHPSTPLTYALSLLMLAAFGVAHEALAAYRVTLAVSTSGKKAAAAAAAATRSFSGSITDPLTPFAGGGGGGKSHLHKRLTASGLYALNLTTGYLLMLAVMTFNVGEQQLLSSSPRSRDTACVVHVRRAASEGGGGEGRQPTAQAACSVHCRAQWRQRWAPCELTLCVPLQAALRRW